MEQIEGPSGKQLFKETVNDFKVIALTFGRNDYLFNQLIDVYNDWGSLNKGVIRIKRTGAGMYDTSYTISPTARTAEVPEMEEELAPVREYFKERYSAIWTPAASNSSANAGDKEVRVEDSDDNLF